MAEDYTALDYVTARDRLVELGKNALPDIDWDSALLPERWLLEQFAFIGQRLGFYQTNNALNSRWGTATQRRAQIAAAKLIGQSLRGARAARATVTFTIVATADGVVTLPAGTAPHTEEIVDPLRFQLLEDLAVSVSAGTTTASVTVENSSSQEDPYVSSDKPNQAFILTQTPFLEGSVTITASNGTFTQVDSFLESQASDLHFTITVDNLDRATVLFGNGAAGAIPTGAITITYRTGGGKAGNVPADAIKVLDGTWTDALGNPVTITVTNEEAAEEGDDRESVAAARERLPRAARTQTIAIAREDFQDGALAVAGVARALALSRSESAAVDENSILLVIVPTAGGAPSDALKTAVRAQFIQQSGYPMPPLRSFQNLDLRVQTPLYVTINVRTKVYLRPGVTGTAGKAAIVAALTDYFAPTITAARLLTLAPAVAAVHGITSADGTSTLSNPLVDFGYNLQDAAGEMIGGYPLCDVYRLISGVSTVARIAGDGEGLLLNGLAQDVAIEAWGFPVLGTVQVIDARLGTAL